ncbi:MAG: hypothetical protein MK033_06065 [Candidatus Caenarcaniphilales bacterium]|nr:hypothetical protein [Candidatus Caenarcaniphilales bacterium]
MNKFFSLILIIFLLCSSEVRADEFLLNLSGPNLDKIAALKILLKIEPELSAELNEEISISGNEAFFVSVNKQASLINIFLKNKAKAKSQINIHGKIDRKNYFNDIGLSVANIEYIADFSQEIDTSLISSRLKIIKKEEQLPFLGISKARIIGPNPRIYSKSMLISIGDIETYGFNLEDNLDAIYVNDVPAELINDKIIISTVSYDEFPESAKIPVTLSLEVSGKKVNKNIGSIDLLEAIDLNVN